MLRADNDETARSGDRGGLLILVVAASAYAERMQIVRAEPDLVGQRAVGIDARSIRASEVPCGDGGPRTLWSLVVRTVAPQFNHLLGRCSALAPPFPYLRKG